MSDRKGIKFSYVLADSWFTNKDIVRFIHSRHIKCHWLGMIKVSENGIFFVRCTQHGKWNGLLTTDKELDFIRAWQIYSRRWALKVVFKDCKTNLGFGKCQSTSFASQIAAATWCCIQYNILSVARRFGDYETIGGLFREISKETVQLSVAQQIWGMLQELVTAIARAFGLSDEEIYDTVINKSEEIAHIAQFYNLKSAS